MDLNEFRSFILESGLDIWTWIDMSISVACADHENELKTRRDGIIQRLYAPAFSGCRNCDNGLSKGSKCDFKEVEGCQQKKDDVGFESVEREEEKEVEDDEDDDNDEKKEILEIKTLLDDENQSEGCLIELLQRLVGMETTFQTLKDTDIGRHASKLRKHSSNEVRRLVKILVRKWKDIVDEWVRLNAPIDEEATQLNDDKVSPEEAQKSSVSCYSTPPKEKVKYNQIKSDKLGSANKRLHDQISQETNHAKKERTEIRDFHNVQKLKNAALSNNGGSVPVRNW
ncbi:Probable mediator of RNA polymerase II transcription subunit 26c [Striga hermonthica]|uniref:Probable mediator of RNA polymerase II transcription subunit 26c n=1 Tax=Striga hermonthica TaxID=68872 RepID=A0A9N7NGZ8_STRHE|nr:Probable mediator of RNA polymerase II transcription subunit 26c [Striga hermonthica]